MYQTIRAEQENTIGWVAGDNKAYFYSAELKEIRRNGCSMQAVSGYFQVRVRL